MTTLHRFTWPDRTGALMTAGSIRNGDDMSIFTGAEGQEGIDGLDLPEMEPQFTPRHGNGTVAGNQRSDSPTVMATVFFPSTETLMRLRASMKPRPDEQKWGFAGFGFDTAVPHRMYVLPSVCDYKVTSLALYGRVWMVTLGWVSPDGVVYTDDVSEGADDGRTVESRTAATSHSFTATNSGWDAVDAGRAWTVSLTASGTVQYPWIQIGDGPRVVFQVTLDAGQVLSVDTNRIVRVGSQAVGGRCVTPGEKGPHWPVLEPGDNEVTLGANSGSFSVLWKHRGTS